jgi:hypothetical protein
MDPIATSFGGATSKIAPCNNSTRELGNVQSKIAVDNPRFIALSHKKRNSSTLSFLPEKKPIVVIVFSEIVPVKLKRGCTLVIASSEIPFDHFILHAVLAYFIQFI